MRQGFAAGAAQRPDWLRRVAKLVQHILRAAGRALPLLRRDSDAPSFLTHKRSKRPTWSPQAHVSLCSLETPMAWKVRQTPPGLSFTKAFQRRFKREKLQASHAATSRNAVLTALDFTKCQRLSPQEVFHCRPLAQTVSQAKPRSMMAATDFSMLRTALNLRLPNER